MLGLVKGSRLKELVLCLVICLFPALLMAKEVGHFTQVEGKVDIQKKGKPEAISVQVQTGAEEQDAVKTEALSRAQIQFIDASTLMVAPLSHITIESYMYNSQKQERGAVCQLAQGLAHLIVNPLAKSEKKEFLIKTKTAILGIRGTDFYILIGPDFTDVFVKSGGVVASSNQAESGKTNPRSGESPEVSNLLRRAEIRAAADNGVLINSMEASRIRAGKIPLPIVRLNEEHFRTLEGLMHIGLPPKLADSANPGELLNKISQPGHTDRYSPPAPPPPPFNIGPIFPGGGGGGGVVASPSA
jgi:hypothetical protein